MAVEEASRLEMLCPDPAFTAAEVAHDQDGSGRSPSVLRFRHQPATGRPSLSPTLSAYVCFVSSVYV
ncbi:hypothetical protein ACOMHN_009650 [Nucella lapillus]